MPGLTLTGFERKTVETIKAEIVSDFLASISPSLDTEAASLLGNFVGIMAAKLGEPWELLELIYRAQDRNGASGNALDVIGALIGVAREPAKESVFTNAAGDAGTVNVVVGAGFSQAPGTMIASVAGKPDARFVNRDTVASVGGGTLTGLVFVAEATGPTEAPTGTLTVIASPIAGWTSVTNTADAIIGAEIESDSAYRSRQVIELARVGSTTVDAIRADLLEVEDVESATVLENDTDTTDGEGLLPHSVEAIVVGGTDADVAKALWQTKAGGIGTNGSDSENVTDSQGRVHVVKITRPTEIPIWLEMTIYVHLDKYPGDAAIKEALVTWAQANLTVGVDVIKNRLVQIVMDQITDDDDADVNVYGIDDVDPTVTSTNFAIGTREIATLDTARISIVVSPL